MAYASRDRDRERLERELQSEQYQELLRRLRGDHSFLHRFATWSDVLAFMRNGTSRDPGKDDVLRPILGAHGKDGDPRWRAILLAIFWPGLESIHFQKRGWDPDPEERWQNIMWTFLKVVCRIDVRRRPHRLVQKVFNDTVHFLHDEYCRQWSRTGREIVSDPVEIEILAGGVEGVDLDGIDHRRAQVKEIARLQTHLEAGRISEADFALLVGTRVYGRSVADHAREVGLDYQVAKKRRQRAEASIDRFESRPR